MAKRLVQGPASPVWLVDADGNPIGDAHPLVIQGVGGELSITDEWEVTTLSDVTADDSDKTFTVPNGYQYQVLWVYVSITSTATAGNRNMAVAVNNALGTQIFEVRAGVTQAASLTYNYTFAPSLADLTAVRDTTFVMCPLPPTLILTAFQQLRVWDQNAVAAGADDMNVFVQIARRAA
ncbi:MAG: hypothetical protein EHM35_00655 [Planctomycetaceae bacterium]|nr:MAG: hypothetical protein EHM35_00655 [Planctomycetaceae bacterium]